MNTDCDTVTSSEEQTVITTDYNRIKEWLLPILDSKGISVENFARAVGISRATVYFYMNDRHRPDEQVMAQMCRVLGVPFEEGLRQYTPKKWGRPSGSGRLRAVTTH
jgi:transcriptional regulator with XRE-family HTH domain